VKTLCREGINKERIGKLLQGDFSIAFLSTKFGREMCSIFPDGSDNGIKIETIRGNLFEVKLADIIQIDFLEEKEKWKFIKEGEALRLSFERIEKKLA
jgi:hypothetical protein